MPNPVTPASDLVDTVLLGFAESQEYEAATISTAGDQDNGEVYRLYEATLDRAPDPAGFAYWTGQLQGGASEESMVIGFSDSAEFRASTSGVTHANWVFIPNAS